MTLKKAAECCGGTLKNCKDASLGISRAVIDSRAVEAGDLFVAYRGEKTDGHRYIQSALDKGAVCALAEYLPAGVEGPVLLVENVQIALEKICTAYLKMLTEAKSKDEKALARRMAEDTQKEIEKIFEAQD